MYIEHPYFYEGKYYANIDGEMIEITKEVAYAMNNFYRSSKAKKVEIKNELGEVVDKMLREVPYSGQSIDGEGFMIEDFPDLNCDVEHCVLTNEYYGAAEPPVRCGESHLSGLTEPPHFVY